MLPAFQIFLRAAARRFRSDVKASVAIYFALSVIPIMAMAGVAIDLERRNSAMQMLQDAMDGAVLMAAAQGSTANAANAFLANGTAAAFNVSGSPSFVAHADGSITGSMTATMPTSLMSVVGFRDMTFAVSATAKPVTKTVSTQTPTTTTTSTTTSTPNAVCILVLDPSGSQSLLVNGGFSINAPNCEIDVASTGKPAAMFNSGITLNVQNICVQGANVTQNSVTLSTLHTGCATAANPYKGKLPAPPSTTCSVSGANFSGNTTINPGVYCGSFNFNGSGTLTLNPGVYVLKNNTNWNINSGWTVKGSGVTFYYADGGSYIQINSGVTFSVSAPTSGTYANILIYEPDSVSNPSGIPIDGSAKYTWSGLIYLPNRTVTFNAMSSVSSDALTIIVNRLILNSNNSTPWYLASGAMTIGSASYSTSTTSTQTTTTYTTVTTTVPDGSALTH
jgi:Flp pilus assembly protein TadG